MTSEYTLPSEEPDLDSARLWAAGAIGVWERPGEVVGYFDGEDAEVPPGGRWDAVADVDWAAAWREGIEPVSAGPFDVVPTWLADDHPERPGRVRIVLDPGRAFGSGHHDTTLGCLEALAGLDLAGREVLDVGTGTGILAIAAARRDAGHVLGVDVDPDAIEVARDNAAANEVAVGLAVGSVEVVRQPFDVVVANLLTQTVVDLAEALLGALVPGGHLVTSGIGAPRADLVADALRRAGLVAVTTRVRGDWAVVEGRRPT